MKEAVDIEQALSFGLCDIGQLSSAMFGGETADNLNPLGIMRGRSAAPRFKHPIEADLPVFCARRVRPT
jgi:hypothetical protein